MSWRNTELCVSENSMHEGTYRVDFIHVEFSLLEVNFS